MACCTGKLLMEHELAQRTDAGNVLATLCGLSLVTDLLPSPTPTRAISSLVPGPLRKGSMK